jgi:hypothetical protein
MINRKIKVGNEFITKEGKTGSYSKCLKVAKEIEIEV